MTLRFVAFAILFGLLCGDSVHGGCNFKQYTVYENRTVCMKKCSRPCAGGLMECAPTGSSFSNVLSTVASPTNGSIVGRCLDPESVIHVERHVQTNVDEHFGSNAVMFSAVSSQDECVDVNVDPEISAIKLTLHIHGQFCGKSTSDWKASLNVQGTIFGMQVFNSAFTLDNNQAEFNQSPNLGIAKADYTLGGYKVGSDMQLKFWGSGCYWSNFVWHCQDFDYVLLTWTP